MPLSKILINLRNLWREQVNLIPNKERKIDFEEFMQKVEAIAIAALEHGWLVVVGRLRRADGEITDGSSSRFVDR